jgi:hypothetical protein
MEHMLAQWVESQGAPALVNDTTKTQVLSYILMKAG